jgi:hypothetical protein
MEQSHTPHRISVDKDGYFATYFKACGALWHVCYNQLHPWGQEGIASKEIDGKTYNIQIDPVDAEGQKLEHDKSTPYIQFSITTNGGNAETIAQLERQLIERLNEIQEKNLPYFAPKAPDIKV